LEYDQLLEEFVLLGDGSTPLCAELLPAVGNILTIDESADVRLRYWKNGEFVEVPGQDVENFQGFLLIADCFFQGIAFPGDFLLVDCIKSPDGSCNLVALGNGRPKLKGRLVSPITGANQEVTMLVGSVGTFEEIPVMSIFEGALEIDTLVTAYWDWQEQIYIIDAADCDAT
jgi:hypothetical protein